MAKIADVQEVRLSKLKPYERNAKIHGADQIEKLKESIREFGFLSPCLIDGDYNLIAGHGRVQAARELGFETVPCVFIDGLTEPQRRAYILADNRLGELASWDYDLIAGELEWLSDEGFDIELTGFANEDAVADTGDIDGVGDEIEELIKSEPRTKRGELWQLGRHRLLVGDSTGGADVARLMGGAKADLLETDPPYNVNISNTYGDTIENDNMSADEFEQFLRDAFRNAHYAMRAGASFYIWHADSNGLTFRRAAEAEGLHIRQNLIWVKNRFTLGRQDYQWIHEPCLYGWKEGAAHYFSERRNIPTVTETEGKTREELIEMLEEMSTVMRADTPLVDDLHPTMKPLELILRQVKNSSRENENVLDLFGGSGTTLVACEQLKRNAFIMEYDPKYADVIIARWEELSGERAVLLDE